MQCVSRAGERRTCAYLKPCPSSPRMSPACTRRWSKRTDRVATGKTAVEALHRPLDDDARRIHGRQKHGRAGVVGLGHDDGKRGAFGTGDEPLAAVDLVVIAIPAGGGGQHRRVRPGPRRRLGHAEARTDFSRGKRTQPSLLVHGRGDRLEQMHVALVRREDVERNGSERRVAGFPRTRWRDRRAREPCRRTRSPRAVKEVPPRVLSRSAPGAIRRWDHARAPGIRFHGKRSPGQ